MDQGSGRGEGFPFPRQYRLTKTDDFSSVFGFRRAIRGQVLLLHYGPSLVGSGARLGLVVGKKQLKKAVDRNRLKRIAREVFRLHRAQLPDLDLVLRLGSKVRRPEIKMLGQEIQHLMSRLPKKLALQAKERHL